jgi:hypothetical protein
MHAETGLRVSGDSIVAVLCCHLRFDTTGDVRSSVLSEVIFAIETLKNGIKFC